MTYYPAHTTHRTSLQEFAIIPTRTIARFCRNNEITTLRTLQDSTYPHSLSLQYSTNPHSPTLRYPASAQNTTTPSSILRPNPSRVIGVVVPPSRAAGAFRPRTPFGWPAFCPCLTLLVPPSTTTHQRRANDKTIAVLRTAIVSATIHIIIHSIQNHWRHFFPYHIIRLLPRPHHPSHVIARVCHYSNSHARTVLP